MKPKAYIQLVVNYKATRTPPKFQIRNKGAFIYYVINIGGGGVSQMLMFVDMGEGGVGEKITDKILKNKMAAKLQN